MPFDLIIRGIIVCCSYCPLYVARPTSILPFDLIIRGLLYVARPALDCSTCANCDWAAAGDHVPAFCKGEVWLKSTKTTLVQMVHES